MGEIGEIIESLLVSPCGILVVLVDCFQVLAVDEGSIDI